jgi:hypothetical protein
MNPAAAVDPRIISSSAQGPCICAVHVSAPVSLPCFFSARTWTSNCFCAQASLHEFEPDMNSSYFSTLHILELKKKLNSLA